MRKKNWVLWVIFGGTLFISGLRLCSCRLNDMPSTKIEPTSSIQSGTEDCQKLATTSTVERVIIPRNTDTKTCRATPIHRHLNLTLRQATSYRKVDAEAFMDDPRRPNSSFIQKFNLALEHSSKLTGRPRPSDLLLKCKRRSRIVDVGKRFMAVRSTTKTSLVMHGKEVLVLMERSKSSIIDLRTLGYY